MFKHVAGRGMHDDDVNDDANDEDGQSMIVQGSLVDKPNRPKIKRKQGLKLKFTCNVLLSLSSTLAFTDWKLCSTCVSFWTTSGFAAEEVPNVITRSTLGPTELELVYIKLSLISNATLRTKNHSINSMLKFLLTFN